MHVLQHAFEVVLRLHAEPLFHAGIPGVAQVAHRELAGQQLVLELVTQLDVQRVGELVGIDADRAALHAREVRVEIFFRPLGTGHAEMFLEQRLR